MFLGAFCPSSAFLTVRVRDAAYNLGGGLTCSGRSPVAPTISVRAFGSDMAFFVAGPADVGSSLLSAALFDLCRKLIDRSDQSVEDTGFFNLGLGFQRLLQFHSFEA